MKTDETYNIFISYVSSLIDDIYIIILNKDKLTSEQLFKQIVDTILKPDNRIMLGVLMIMLSFILYILDVTTE